MKITKKTIQACDEMESVIAEVPVDVVEEIPDKADPVLASTASYEQAINFIHDAIDALGAVAKNDPIARESIANLSVVLFDLKG